MEDDRKTASLIALYLRHAGHRVHVEHDGHAARSLLDEEIFDLLVLDVMLPGVDGLTLCQHARRRTETAIILLTARVQEEDRVAGLEQGADDYVLKPFSPRELVARVHALLRRLPPGGESVLSRGRLRIDLGTCEALVDGKGVRLTSSELAVLVALARRPGRVLSRAQILGHLPGHHAETLERTIDVHIRNLRRKIEPEPATPIFVETVIGVGYRFAPHVTKAS